MNNETQIKFRFTLGSVIMWISFLLPFMTFFDRFSGREIQVIFWAATFLLILGFSVYSWEDHRAKKRFSWGMLIYLFMMLFFYAVATPVFMSAAVASGRYYKDTQR